MFLLVLIVLGPRLPAVAKLFETVIPFTPPTYLNPLSLPIPPPPLIDIASLQKNEEILDDHHCIGEREWVCVICERRFYQNEFYFRRAVGGSRHAGPLWQQWVRASEFWATVMYAFLSIQSNQVRNCPTGMEYQAVETTMSNWKWTIKPSVGWDK